MPREVIPNSLKVALGEFLDAQEKGRLETNKANRLKTAARNAVASVWEAQEIPIGSFIHVDGKRIDFSASESSYIDPKQVWDLLKKKQITEDQFLRMLKIDTGEAGKILGADVVADVTVKTVGSKLDIRVTDLPVENKSDNFIAVERKVRAKVERARFGKTPERATVPAAPVTTPRRRAIRNPKDRS